MKCAACDYPYASCDRCPNCGCTSPGSFCFITEAACTHLGLSDDCRELTVLRGFRDTYLLPDPKFRESVDFYYLIAPRIVDSIQASGRSAQIYSYLLEAYLRPSIEAIDLGKPEDARRIYTQMMRELSDTHVFRSSLP